MPRTVSRPSTGSCFLAALTGLGVALVDVTSNPLGDHAQNVRGELQDNIFDTSWTEHIPVGPSGEGMPDLLQSSGTTSGTTDGGTTDTDTTDSDTTDHDTSDNDTTDSDTSDSDTTDSDTTDPDQDPTPDPDPTSDPDSDQNGGGGTSGPIVPASNVEGCPDSSSYIANPVARTGDQLVDNRIRVSDMTVGGATTNLVNCPGITGIGHFYANPTYTLDLSGMSDDFLALPGAHEQLLRYRDRRAGRGRKHPFRRRQRQELQCAGASVRHGRPERSDQHLGRYLLGRHL